MATALDEFEIDRSPPAVPSPTTQPAGSRRPRALGWIAVGLALVLGGVLLAPPPPGSSYGLVEGAGEPTIAWTAAPLPGAMWLTLAGETVVVQDAETAYAYRDGALVWQADAMDLCDVGTVTVVCPDPFRIGVNVIDTNTGEVEFRPDLLTAAPFHDGLLVIDTEYDVRRLDAHGQVVWQTTLDGTVSNEIHAVGAWVAVFGVDTIWILDGESGEVVATTGAAQFSDGRILAIDNAEATLMLADGTILDPVPFARYPWLEFDDAPDSGVQITWTGDGDIAVAGSSGALWTSLPVFAPPLGRLDGVLVSSDMGEIWANDVTTGQEAWRVARSAATSNLGATHDAVLWRAPADSVRGMRLVATSIADGSTVWEIPLEGRDQLMTAVDGSRMAVLTEAELLLLEW